MFQDGGKRTSVFFYLSNHNTYLGICRSDYDCQLFNPTRPNVQCVNGRCIIKAGLLYNVSRWRKRDQCFLLFVVSQYLFRTLP